MHLVKCNICSTIEGKPKYYVTKWDITSRRWKLEECQNKFIQKVPIFK
jgi:hypothetical protein